MDGKKLTAEVRRNKRRWLRLTWTLNKTIILFCRFGRVQFRKKRDNSQSSVTKLKRWKDKQESNDFSSRKK